ncbi:hypothetical protein ACIB24_01230 [Spongisporangium articulatum]|uniref:DUF4367 domain-containing protein n=1 Tax=Spongisporangium articulatum TaxID=3362603 RepID=A0ABW8AH52_9ACTN
MIDEALLHELAEYSTLRGPRPLPEISARARLLRRRRRTASTGFGVLAVCIATGVAVPMLSGGDTGVQVVDPARGAEPDCTAGTGDNPSPAQIPDVLYVPDESLTGPRTGAILFRRDRPNCGVGLEAVWYTTRKKVVDKTLSIQGPDRPDYYGRADSPEFAGGTGVSHVEVEGSPGTLHYDESSRFGRLFWVRPDGTRWMAEGRNMSATELVTSAGAVRLSAERIDGGQRPGGMTPAPRLGGPAWSTSFPWTFMEFGGTGEESRLQLTFEQYGDRPMGPAGRGVEIDGRPGWLSSDDGRTTLVWKVADGVVGQLTGRITKAQALAIARSTIKVTPDDSRLQ